MTSPPAPQTSPLHTRFLEAGMRVLARDGYAGFKQSAVCTETGLTTGAFYHSFPSWKSFERDLIDYWRRESTERLVDWVESLPSPHGRIDALIEVALTLPHRTEAAIRVWAAGTPEVAEAVTQVDDDRTAAVTRAFEEIGIDAQRAARLAGSSMLMLIGHEASGGDVALFEWSMRHTLETDPHVIAALAAADRDSATDQKSADDHEGPGPGAAIAGQSASSPE